MKFLIFFPLLFCLTTFAQTKLFHLDLTDTTNFTFGGTDSDGRRTVYEVRGSGTYNPVFRQSDTTKQPIWRFEEGLYFNYNNPRYMTLTSGSKIIPTTATVFVVARHLGRTPTTQPAYIIGDTNSFVGYDDVTKGLRVFSTTGGYLQRRIDEYGGMKSVLTFRIKSNVIDTLFIQGTPNIGSITIGNNLKFGILGAYHNGTAFDRYFSGYIYEIIVYDGNLSNTQIDSINNVLSNKHKTPIKPLTTQTVPYSTQPRTGAGTENDPFLIYSVWALDSLRYVYPKNQVYHIKLMNDIDFSQHENFYIDSLTLSIDGNGKKFKNWYHHSTATNESHCLFSSYLSTTIKVKNLIFENFMNISPAGLYSNSTASFLYKYSTTLTVRIDSIIVKRSLIRAETRATTSYTVFLFPFAFEHDTVTRVGFLETEIILSSKSNTSTLFNVTNNTIEQVFTDKHSLLGKYFTSGGGTTSIMNFSNSFTKNSFFKHKTYYVEYGTNENGSTTASWGAGVSTECCYPIRNTRYIDKSYFSTKVLYTVFNKANQTISLDGWYDSAQPLDSVYVDTTFNRKFLYYPSTTYTGAKPQPKSQTQMQNQSTFVNWDFTNIWRIDPAKNDGMPYLSFYTPESQQIRVKYPNSNIIKYGGDTLNISFESAYDTNKIFL